jgi:uncharacterized protein with FMN-binding domain
VNSRPPVSGSPAPKRTGHGSEKRTKRNLMLMGSAAVVAVYTAGFFHTAEAAAKMAADERDRANARGRGNNRESDRPETAPTPTVAAAPVASLPLATPATPPPAAVPATLQTPVPAASPAPAVAAVPSAPVATPAVTAVTAPTPAPATPVSVPNPVPTSPVQVAAIPAAPVPATPASPAGTAVPASATAVQKKYKDGGFFGWGYCRHGELKVTVVLQDDKIVSAEITECYTRYSKNVISRLPKQLVDRQNPAKLDRISGASDSSDAYYYAVMEALKAAKL